MCAIFGMVNLAGRPLRHPGVAPSMGTALGHRGPDGSGRFERAHVIIASERLRINDLASRGDQPFSACEDRVVLACNGEIYNADELRERFDAHPYRSSSDVEPLLPLYLDRGPAAPDDVDGMFALAVWDDRSSRLTLARDRAGEKPLYYCRHGDEVWFASELQALLLHPELSREPDATAIGQYHALGYVPEPRTPFLRVRKVPAGSVLELDAGGERLHRYWDPYALASAPAANEADAEELDRLLEKAVTRQLQSDVPVGVFLSGGLDSALIASLAAQHSPPESLESFTASFEARSYDEADVADRVARRFGIRQNRVVVNEDSLRTAFDALLAGPAEPLADPALLPTYLLAQRARERGVIVVLGGEGADELFGGYPTYLGHALTPWLRALPSPLKRLAGRMAALLPASRQKVPLETLVKRLLAECDREFLERHLTWFGTGLLLQSEPAPPPEAASLLPAGLDDVRSAMLLDYVTYLRDNLLPKIDRATMLCSVEARAPFLDRDLARFAFALPRSAKIRRFQTKWLLKKAARARLPHDIIDRRKRGLSVPIADWLDGGLRGEVDRLLEPGRLQRQGIVDAATVSRLVAEHRAKQANHARPLWTALTFQRWLEHWAPELNP